MDLMPEANEKPERKMKKTKSSLSDGADLGQVAEEQDGSQDNDNSVEKNDNGMNGNDAVFTVPNDDDEDDSSKTEKKFFSQSVDDVKLIVGSEHSNEAEQNGDLEV